MTVLLLIAVSIILGPLGQITTGNPQVHLYVSDISAGSLLVYWLLRPRQLYGFIIRNAVSRYFFVFAGVALVSLVTSPIPLDGSFRFISGLYLLRLLAYFSFYPTISHLIRLKKITVHGVLRTLAFSGIVLSVLGWLQYILYPDLRNLFYLSWDPHFKRIFATYLDPNFLGLMLILTLIALYYLKAPKLQRVTGALITLLTLLFTYSRGSFLALTCASIFVGIRQRKVWIAAWVIAVIAAGIMYLPQKEGQLGLEFGRMFSIEQRIDNFRQGLVILARYPVLGVGFNTLRYAKHEYGLLGQNWEEIHSAAGLENSFLFVAATSGLAGLAAYILYLSQVFRRGDMLVKTSLVAILVHTQFVNSIFYPWVMLWMWVVCAAGVLSPKESKSP